MAIEREPPKDSTSPAKPRQSLAQRNEEPAFGKASPLRSNLPFIMPKKNHPRPEHHRPVTHSENPDKAAPINTNPLNLGGDKVHSGYQKADDVVKKAIDPLRPLPPSSQNWQGDNRLGPSSRYAPPSDGDVVEIPRPANSLPAWANQPPTWQSKAPVPKTYASFFEAAGHGPANFVDLTAGNNVIGTNDTKYNRAFGAPDPSTYVNATDANESIKALLEGTFDDDNDTRPRTRSRKKKTEAKTRGVIDMLGNMKVADASSEVKEAKVEKAVKDEHDEGEEDEDEDDDEDDGTVEGLDVKLLPHQIEGVYWMIDKEVGQRKNGTLPKGGILADDMGLGKTLQSIALMLLNPRPSRPDSAEWATRKLPEDLEKNTLVVAPLALIKQWEKEINSRVSESHRLRVCVHHGPQRNKRFQDLKKYDVVITTYQVLVSEHGSSSNQRDGVKTGCFGLHWYRVILDEAHTIKNRNAKATQACYGLRAQYRWCLTGTPMQNNLDELQSLIKFLRIRPYSELAVWKDHITRPMAQGKGGLAIKRLQYILKAFMKRRTKEILKKDGALIPGGKPSASGTENANGFRITERKIEKVFAEFSPRERAFYERLERRTDKSLDRMMDQNQVSYASALVLLLRLRQVCNHPELIAGKLSKDKDALATGDGNENKSPKKPKAVESKDVDDIANMLGGLSVETKECEGCLTPLSKEEISGGAIRCGACADDLDFYKREKTHVKREKGKKKPASIEEQRQRRARQRRPRIADSEDENEGEGDWIVPKSQHLTTGLGKAGGSDDENAEGGGEEIGSEDTNTEDESSIRGLGRSKTKAHKVISLDSSDDNASSSESEDEMEGGFQGSSGDEGDLSSLILSTKIRHLLGILHQESRKHKFIVFSQFTSMLDLIEPFLKRDGLVFTRYDGGMRNDLREASLERLRNESKTRILLCSLKCGSLGLNLTAASRVVILEPFWNPFVEEQAIDRVHRLNQTVNVIVYKITVKETVEERILELQEKKRELANAAIEGKAVGKLNMKDILHLFRRDAEHTHQEHGSGNVQGPSKPLVPAEPTSSSWKQGEVGNLPPARAEGNRVASGSKEHALYGRRW
ncbi:MAG: hypothetical protein M1837_002412 [Sclerophora amabilis]|nr:MAG: hypothetical protein M1837_002412 [Sclerophora amabilis]